MEPHYRLEGCRDRRLELVEVQALEPVLVPVKARAALHQFHVFLGLPRVQRDRRELVVVVFCPLHVEVLQQDPVLDQCVTSDRRLECDCVMESICADCLCSLDIGATLGPTVVVQRGVQLWDSLARSNHKSLGLYDDWRR